MNTKEFLQQAFLLDKRINSKIQQLQELEALATNCTAVMSDMPKAPSGSTSRLEDTVLKIIEQKHEINDAIDRLVDVKSKIQKAIDELDNTQQQFVLEQRYLCMRSWEEIARDLGCSTRHTSRLHNAGIKNLKLSINV